MANSYGLNGFANDNYYDSDSSSDYGTLPPFIEGQRYDSNSSSYDSSVDTASIANSTTCSWDMLANDMEELEISMNNEILIVSAPPRFIRTPMGLSTSTYEAMVAEKN